MNLPYVAGNVVYLALGVIISVAFGKIVSSLVADIIMLPLGLLIGSVNFKQLHLVLREAQGTVPAVVINYGLFIQTIFDFVIVAFAIFLAIKLMKKARHKQEEKPVTPPAPTAEEKLLTEIRDLLSQQQPKL